MSKVELLHRLALELHQWRREIQTPEVRCTIRALRQAMALVKEHRCNCQAPRSEGHGHVRT